ncbi:hypothetical protein [Acinetobacter sp.]|uniref:hypothetical protein n=1 Tax=Acinetobacter sp. TaxID=472 RepID=UPI0035B4261E
MAAADHEVVRLFREQVQPLSGKLTEMLNEHYSHQTERRGCGYTQATRVLAEHINAERKADDFQDLKLFDAADGKCLLQILAQQKLYSLQIADWRNLDLNSQIQDFLKHAPASGYQRLMGSEVRLQQRLRGLGQQAALEESRLLCGLIEDILLPKNQQQTGLTELNSLRERPKVGSCPMAENFFLKIAHRRVLRSGEINIFVDEQNQPLLLEKLNMGDNHSCISLKPVLMNGVRLPAGSLFSADYAPEAVEEKQANKEFKGFIMPYTAVSGFWFLRLTTLAVSPENRRRAFSTHFEQQVANGLYSPGSTQIQQLLDVALAQFR